VNALDARLTACRREGRAALVCYLMAGYPDEETFRATAADVISAGADIIEVGIPYSDPVADGPIIQAAGHAALGKGIVPSRALELAGEVARLEAPVLAMGYYNPIHKLGEEAFAIRCQELGICGAIIPDLPLEESRALRQAMRRHESHLILMIGPYTDEKRAEAIDNAGSGMLYLVSRPGTTGMRSSSITPDLISRAKKAVHLPLAVGFGISDAKSAREVAEMGADAVVVGSALLAELAEGRSPVSLVRSLRSALNSSAGCGP
jgi:tryptophan synthase alpha chain